MANLQAAIKGLSKPASGKKRKVINLSSPKGKAKVEAAGHEMKVNPPAILEHTAKKFGAERADKQRVAIMLNKARTGK